MLQLQEISVSLSQFSRHAEGAKMKKSLDKLNPFPTLIYISKQWSMQFLSHKVQLEKLVLLMEIYVNQQL